MFESIIDIGSRIMTTFQTLGSFFTYEVDAFGLQFTPLDLMFGVGLAFVLTWILSNFLIPN